MYAKVSKIQHLYVDIKETSLSFEISHTRIVSKFINA